VPLGSGLHLRVPLYHRLYVYDQTPCFWTVRSTWSRRTRRVQAARADRGPRSPGDALTFHRGRSGREPRVYIEERLRAAVVSAARGFNADALLSPQIERQMRLWSRPT